MGGVQAVSRSDNGLSHISEGQTLQQALVQLADKKCWEKIEQIFKDNPNITLAPEPRTGRLPLHLAILRKAPPSILKCLLALNAQSASVKDAAGETPLLYALTDKPTLKVARLFIEFSQSCLSIGDARGVLPVHKAIEYKADTAIVCELLRANPQAASTRTNDGKLALHYACEHQSSIEITSLLLEYNPRATAEIHNGRLPLHYACENKTTLETVTALYKAHQAGAACKGVDGKQPLHMAVQLRCALTVVDFLVQAYPDALLHRDRKGMHPIHYALERVAPDDIIRCLLSRRPDTAQLRGKGSPGNFPLCTAIEKHYCPDIVRLILHAHPPAAAERNMLGFWPLQLCMKAKVFDIPLLTELLQAYPAAASLVDEHGRRVVHYAASRNLDLSFVKALLETDPAGASAVDKNGQIPLHLAVKRGHLELITLLLSYHPAGVLDMDRYGMVALNYAIEGDVSLSILDLLLKTDRRCAENIISGHRTVLHQAVEFRRSTEVIQALVRAYPEATKIHESALGRLPLHWAIERLLPLPTLVCIDDANPTEGAFKPDHRGWRSIHYAVYYPTPTPIVCRLLRANPNLAITKDDSLHLQYYATLRAEKPDLPPVVASEKEVFLLLHYATQHNALPETVAEILLYIMPYTRQGVFHPNHCDTWVYIMAHCGDRYWQSVDIVLSHYEHDQALINQLAEFRDQTTQRCLDIATPRSLHEILRRMYYFSRYEMHKQLSLHRSQYALSHSAIYHNTTFGATIVNNPTIDDNLGDTNSTASIAVVLKFTSHRSKFIREISVRTQKSVAVLDPQFVVPLLGYHNAQEDLKYAAETRLKGFAKYPFLLVCKQGDRDLNAIMKHEYVKGTDLRTIRAYMVQLLRALRYLHEEAGLVHGDIKPSNIIREGGALKLTNLGTAAKHRDKELVSAELRQLAYAAPELALLQRDHDMLRTAAAGLDTVDTDGPAGGNMAQGSRKHFNNQGAQLKNRVYSLAPDDAAAMDLPNDLAPQPNKPGERILSAPSQDMWSIGCIFYLLLTGESLFLTDVSEDIDSDQVDILAEWPDFVKQRRLEKVQDIAARCLLSQLLSRNPLQRPSAEYCLQHPFIADTTPLVRFIGAPTSSEVYICYRRDKVVPIPEKLEPPVVVVAEDEGSAVDEADQAIEVKEKNLSALERMFGICGGLGDESQSLDGEGSLAEDSQGENGSQEEKSPMGPVAMAMPLAEGSDDITTPIGRFKLLRQYFNERGTLAADSQPCPLVIPLPLEGGASAAQGVSHATSSTTVPSATSATGTTGAHNAAISDSTITVGTDAALSITERLARGAAQWGREMTLSKCGAAVILLTRDTWKALEDRCAELTQAHQRRVGSVSMKANKATGPSATHKRGAAKSEEELADAALQLQLLDDFLYEVRLILELQSMGLLENGVYVIAAGEAVPPKSGGNQANERQDRVLGEYFQQYMGDMIGRYGGSHPTATAPTFTVPELESRLAQCLTVCGYGVASHHTDLTLNDLFRYLVRLPTFHAIGPERDAFRTCVEGISAVIYRTAHIARAVTSRPNTGAFNLYHAARIATPLLVPATDAQSTRLSGVLKKNSFSLNKAGNRSFSAHSMADLTSGLTAVINPIANAVSWDASVDRTLLRSRSGRAMTPQLAPLSHSRPISSDQSLRPNPLPVSAPAEDPGAVPRSPISGLRVRAYTPSKSPRHIGYADSTAQLPQLTRGRINSGGFGGSWRSDRAVSPLHSGARPFSSSRDLPDRTAVGASAAGGDGGSIPVRPWSGAGTQFTHNQSFRNTASLRSRSKSGDENDDFAYDGGVENEVTFYNNEDIVTVPYFTEVVGEDRTRTASAIHFMHNKLEASENQIANLEDELTLLRSQLATRDAELKQLRAVVASNSVQSPVIPRKKLK